MQTWLFQANPKTFDIDAFLATRPSSFLWLVTRSGNSMRVGDRVFLWRAIAGEDEARSGVLAEAEMTDTPSERAEDAASRSFWLSGDPAQPRLRVRLRTVRVAGSAKEVVQRKWALEDPVLRDMTILKAPNATNFLLTDEQAARLSALWAKTGRNFTYGESVAALWVYKATYGGPVSRLPGSPVADMALRIGRAVPGLYNKIMNFRHLDPRDERAGLSGGGDVDSSVWSRFFDAQSRTLRAGDLDSEYRRLWGTTSAEPPDAAIAREEAVEREASRLTSESLPALLARHRAAGRSPKPKVATAPGQRFERDPLVVAIAKVRARFRCEVPGCAHPIFLDRDGRAYCEVHHIEPLAAGGDDSPKNAACICPAHHREAHHGARAGTIRDDLLAVRRSEERRFDLTLESPEAASVIV
jgi:hypothetical protein